MSGFGKTSSVLTGAILAATEDDKHVMYVCRTKRQVFRVMEEVGRIQSRMPVRAVQLFAKTDYCLLKETAKFSVNQESFSWYCNFNTTNNLCSYFLNLALLSTKVGEMIQDLGDRASTHSELLRSGREAHVCPYEIARIATTNSRIVATTYHYFLDEKSRSHLLANAGWKPSETMVVIDEAHNLRDFLRDNHTAQLSFADIQRAKYEADQLYMESARTFLDELEHEIRALASERDSWYVRKDDFVRRIQKHRNEVWLPNLALELSTCAGVGWETIATGRNLPTSIMKIGSFLTDLIISDDGSNLAKSEDAFFLVKADSPKHFRQLIDGYRSVVLLSATINPYDLFLKSIGLDEDTALHAVLPNHKFKVKTVVDTGTSTRFKTRNPEMYSKIVSKVAAVCRATGGSVGVFFPSYVMLETLAPLLTGSLPSRNIIMEERNMTNDRAERVMDEFKTRRGSILLAVQGARFSEGEDFPGDQMDASVVVGLSLPPPSPIMYAEFAQSQFNKHDTYLLVSLLPAVRKAVQSAGRHIRSPDKKGMVFLFDSRFAQPELLRIMPPWIKGDIQKGDFRASEIDAMTRGFFN